MTPVPGVATTISEVSRNSTLKDWMIAPGGSHDRIGGRIDRYVDRNRSFSRLAPRGGPIGPGGRAGRGGARGSPRPSGPGRDRDPALARGWRRRSVPAERQAGADRAARRFAAGAPVRRLPDARGARPALGVAGAGARPGAGRPAR